MPIIRVLAKIIDIDSHFHLETWEGLNNFTGFSSSTLPLDK